MANWRQRFPSKYLQAADLDDDPIDATIKAVYNERVGTDTEVKPVVTFREPHVKPVVLNRTRCEAIETIAGSFDDAAWPGTRIRLQAGTTFFQGKKVPCIDIVAPPSTGAPKRSKPKAPIAPEPDDPMPEVVDEDGSPF
jgi:hypothetical protein